MSERVGREWAVPLARSTHEVITEMCEARGYVANPGLETLIREVVGFELDKFAHKYVSRSGMIAPNNVAYHLSEQANIIRSWVPHWIVRATDDAGNIHVYDLGTDEIAAAKEARLLEPDVKEVEVSYE